MANKVGSIKPKLLEDYKTGPHDLISLTQFERWQRIRAETKISKKQKKKNKVKKESKKKNEKPKKRKNKISKNKKKKRAKKKDQSSKN